MQYNAASSNATSYMQQLTQALRQIDELRADQRAVAASANVTDADKEYCLQNNTVCVFTWHENNLVKHIVGKDLMLQEAEQEEGRCNVCLNFEGTHGCRNSTCEALVCESCYHSIKRSPNPEKCPFCTGHFM